MGKNMELDAPHVTFILSAMQKITRKKEGLGPKNIAVSFVFTGRFCDFDRFFMDLESSTTTPCLLCSNY